MKPRNIVAPLCATVVAIAATAQPPTSRPIETLPAKRGGQDLVGTRFPAIESTRRIEAPADADEDDIEPQVTLYRWWTDSCPFCEASLPAIEQLRTRYRPRGLRVIAVYHPKPPRRVADDAILAAARARKYGGEVAVDEDWSALRKVWLDGRRRQATSVTFLVDRDGIIRFVHPGPVFHPSRDPRFARENADFRLVEQAIRLLIEEAEARDRPEPSLPATPS